MSNWKIGWEPQRVIAYGLSFNTQISRFESGKEQRRKKWNRPRFRFELIFDVLADSTTHEIREFFESVGGSFEAFTFPNFGQRIKGTRLDLGTAGGVHRINDSLNGFIKLGFNTDLQVTINGSTQGNDGVYPSISTVTAGTLTLLGTPLTANEWSNANLEVYTTYKVRFFEDSLSNLFLKSSIGSFSSIELIEDI